MQVHWQTKKALALGAVAAIAACLVAATSANATPKATGTTITVGIQQGYNVLPVFAGIRKGFFKKAGITDVKFTLFTSLPAMLTAVAQGQLDIGLQTIPTIVAYNKASSGTKLKIVAPVQLGSAVFAARADTTIPVATKTDWKSTVLAWKGKKIGVPAPNGIIDLYAKYMIKEAGLQPGDVTTVTVGVGPPAIAALQQGIVDVISGDILTEALLRANNTGKSVLSFYAEQGPPELVNALTGTYFTSDAEIAANPKLYAAFAEGLRQTRAWMKLPSSKASLMDLLMRKLGYSRAEADILYQTGIPAYARAQLSKRVVGASLKAYYGSGVMTGTQPGYDFFVADFAK